MNNGANFGACSVMAMLKWNGMDGAKIDAYRVLSVPRHLTLSHFTFYFN